MKKTTLISIVLFCFSIILIGSFSSFKTGLVNQTTQGCFCHNMPTDSAILRLLNAPVNGFVAGQTYSLSIEVENLNFLDTAHRAGFNLAVSKGSLQAGPGSRLSMTELTHEQPATLQSGKATWNFTWQAPSTNDTGDVTIFVAGVVANGDDLASSSDVEGMTTFTIAKANPVNLLTIETGSISLSPNPANTFLNINLDQEMVDPNVSIRNLYGAVVEPETLRQGKKRICLNTTMLANGIYFVSVQAANKMAIAQFVIHNH